MAPSSDVARDHTPEPTRELPRLAARSRLPRRELAAAELPLPNRDATGVRPDGLVAAQQFAEAVSAGIHEASLARALAGGGRALPTAIRAQLERSLGADLSSVRIHDDEAADAAARERRADAFALGSNVVFAAGRFAPESRSGLWLLAHELAHTIQQRTIATAVQCYRPDGGTGDAHEAEASAAADRAVADGDPATATTPPGARVDARFGPAAIALLRVTVGLPRRGTLDAAFMTAARNAAGDSTTAPAPPAAPGAPPAHAAAPATDELDWPTVRELPFFAAARESNPVRTWYASPDGVWSHMEAARRTRAIAAVIAAFEVTTTDIAWSETDRRPHLVVSPHFIQRAVAWQVWQRDGMTLDGKLGNQALAILGIGVDGAAAARVSVDVADGIAAPAGTTFTQRLEGAVGAGRTTAITGEATPQVGLGAAMGGLTPAAFVTAMYAAHQALVSSTFFPGTTGAHSLDDVLATLELAAGATRRLSELATTPGFGALQTLIGTPESAALQHAQFATARLDPMLALVAPLGSQVSCGVVMLSVLVGSATGVDLSSNASAQAGFIHAYLGDDATVGEPYLAAVLRGETPVRPDPCPARLRTLERAMLAFRPFWATPYPGADVDPTTVAGAAAPTSAAVAPAGPVTLALLTGAAAGGGDAMIAHSTADTRLADAWTQLSREGLVPHGFETDWAAYSASFHTIAFLNGTATGHRFFLEKLAQAQASLVAQGVVPRTAGIVNSSSAMSQLRELETAAGLSYHHLGLAIDISAGANPWISAGRSGTDRDHAHADRGGTVALISWYAAWLMGRGEAMSAAQASAMTTEEDSTGAIYDRLAASSGANEAYLALAGDPAAIETRLRALGTPPHGPTGYDAVPDGLAADLRFGSATAWTALATDSRAQDAAHWSSMIASQAAAWRREVGAGARGHLGAFMTQNRQLVIAMRDVAGLAWGACDFGATSSSAGDFMHFDARPFFTNRAYTRFKALLQADGHDPPPPPARTTHRR